MQTLRIALAQINTTVGDLDGNRRLMLAAARRAVEQQADLVAFPELAVTGYPPEDLLLRHAFISDAEGALQRLAEDARGLPPLIVGCLDFDHHLYNAAAVIHDGRVVGRYRKHELPNYGVFDEERYFQRGTEAPLFVIGGVEIGITICEDIWYSTGPLDRLALDGARLIININASPFHAGKTRNRERIVATRAADSTVAVAYVNQIGGQDELVFDGNSLIVDADGALLARGASMAEDLLVIDVDVEQVLQRQLHESRLRRHRVPGPRSVPVFGTGAPTAERAPLAAASVEPPDELDEIYRALVTGTGDYVRKSGFEHVYVSLSGGIDSALVAAIAADALDGDHVTGIAMPSRYSSEGSLADARDLAGRLGMRLITLPIEPMHAAALEVLEAEFAGTEPGTAEENLQSRIRGMLIMALSNKHPRSMVLTTGNKSEYACGYATLYGDMAGGYAVIKDVAKTLVWRLARHRNESGEVIPPSSIEKPPSAELRPGQLDTDSLPPYEVLDPIIEAYVEDDLPVDSIVARGFDPATVRRVVELINRNEYKRRQAPPGVKISPRAFGRDRRLPLATRYRGY